MGEAMTERLELQEDTDELAPEIFGDLEFENFDGSPDSFVALQYKEHKNPEYIRVSARNHHPHKKIHAFFYTMHEKGGQFIPTGKSESTIQTCLNPSETAVVHFEEKKHNPRLFLFNAFFEDGD